MKMLKKKRLFVFLIGGMMAVSQIGGTAIIYANNCSDTAYSHTYNGDGSDYYTAARAKKDKSASYVNNNGKGTHGITAAVSNGSYHVYSSYYKIKAGNRKYMKNTVYQKGYRSARIAMAVSSGRKGLMKGVWSPDNCSGY